MQLRFAPANHKTPTGQSFLSALWLCKYFFFLLRNESQTMALYQTSSSLAACHNTLNTTIHDQLLFLHRLDDDHFRM